MNNFYKDFLMQFNKYISEGPSEFYDIFYSTDVYSKNCKNSHLRILPNNYYFNNINNFEFLYTHLEDNYSKKRFIEYLAFRSLLSNCYSLPLDIKSIQNTLIKIETFKVSNKVTFSDKLLGDLYTYNLEKLGFDVNLIGNKIGVYLDFVSEQYRYRNKVHAEKNDVVIDCGGAIGDTAVYFSSYGVSKIYLFEFIEDSIKIILKQLEINNISNVEIIKKAVWNTTGENITYEDNGNATYINSDLFKEKFTKKTTTLSIDDLVKNQNILKVDFIKMDIEGSELKALIGASSTIKKYKPKLAISVYHKQEDMIEIPILIKKLNKNYKLYFDYYTSNAGEAILYAINN